MARRIARPIHLGLGWLFLLALLVQVFLAGMGVFSGAESFVTHRDFGYTLGIVPLVLIVTALVGGYGRSHAIAAGVMVVQFILQSVLVLQRDTVPAIAALHPVNGFLIALVAAWLARDAWGKWQAGAPVAASETAASEVPAA